MALLTAEQVQRELGALPGWEQRGKAIQKRYSFPSFPDSIGFVNRVADLAESADHHPDITIQYNAVTLDLSTHSEGGVTEKDVALARQIEEAAR